MKNVVGLWVLMLTACGGGGSEPLDGGASPNADAAADGGASDSAPADAGPPPDVGDPLSWAVGEAGPFHAGYRTFEHTYVPAGQTAPRTIPIHVWYPTFATTGEHPTYVVYRDRDAVTNAPPAPPSHEGGLYPLVVYSHGSRGFGGTAHFLHRHLASHGWVVVAPDHVGNTLTNDVDPRPVALYYERSLDVSEAIDALDELDVGDPLAGRIETRRTVLVGHSFGTHTVWASSGATFDVDLIASSRCSATSPCTAEELAVFRAGVRDPRMIASVPMAGAISRDWFGASGWSSVTIPMFSLSGGANPVGADQQFADVVGLDFAWAEIAGACHEFFALGCGAVDPPGEQARVVGALVLAFVRRHVLEDTQAGILGVLDGSVSVSDRVTLMRR